MFYPLLGINLAMTQNSNLEVFGQYNIVSKPFFIGHLLWKNVPKDRKTSSEFNEFKCNAKIQITENCSCKACKKFCFCYQSLILMFHFISKVDISQPPIVYGYFIYLYSWLTLHTVLPLTSAKPQINAALLDTYIEISAVFSMRR